MGRRMGRVSVREGSRSRKLSGTLPVSTDRSFPSTRGPRGDLEIPWSAAGSSHGACVWASRPQGCRSGLVSRWPGGRGRSIVEPPDHVMLGTCGFLAWVSARYGDKVGELIWYCTAEPVCRRIQVLANLLSVADREAGAGDGKVHVYKSLAAQQLGYGWYDREGGRVAATQKRR